MTGPKLKLRGTVRGDAENVPSSPAGKFTEYPLPLPELFPWFYDKNYWVEYLDFLAANRMNTLYLWSGHPFPVLAARAA